MANTEIKAGALFSGIGGMCLGFEKSGIKTIWAVENDPAAVSTYRQNVKDVRIIEEDVRKVSVDGFQLEPVDILHAGFPCQSFSQAGERRGFDDPRGKLFFEIIRIIKEFKDKKPAVLIFENAPYIKIGDGGTWFLELSRQIKRAGYWFRESNCAELDTYDLTPLPQKRNRLFMAAFLIKKFRNGRFDFPSSVNGSSNIKDLRQFIDFSGNVKDPSYYLDKENRYYHLINKHIEDKFRIYQLRKYLVRVKEPGICPTLTANMGLGGHNVPFVHDKKGIRKLTEYECLKLQGFPDSFKFPDDVTKAKRYMQVGNSVSVPIAELLSKNLITKIVKESF